jgi:membrane fusion protein, multidrug efflux system
MKNIGQSTPRHWFAGIAALCALSAAGGCDKPPAPAAGAFVMPPALVTVAPAVARDVPEYLDEIGKCAAREVVTIQPQVGGKIIELAFTDGADIKTGDLLFRIDPAPSQAVLDEARGTLAQNEADLALAKAQLNRAVEMFNTHAISPDDLDTRKSAVAIAEAKIQTDKAAIAAAQINLNYCTIRAPIDGRAGQRLVDLGNVVTGGGGQMAGTNLLVIQRLSPIYADFTIPESQLSSVRAHMAAGTLTTFVRLPEDPEFTRKGDLTFLDNAVQDATGTIKLRATLPNADRHFWPGQFVQVRLVVDIRKNAVLVDNQATQINQKGTFVYVVKPDSTAELRQVTLGQRQGDMVIVATGLAVGEQVIVTGQRAVNDGAKVKIDVGAESTTAPATSPATGPTSGKAEGAKS